MKIEEATHSDKDMDMDESSDCISSMEDVNHTKNELKEIFKTIEYPSDYAVGGKSTLLPTCPGLYVDSIGDIPLPICPQQRELLIEKAKKSSCYCGFTNSKDKTSNESYELPPEPFHFKNPRMA